MKFVILTLFLTASVVFAQPPKTQREWIENARSEISKVRAGADFAWGQMNAAYSQLGVVQIELGKKQGEIDQIVKQRDNAEIRLGKITPKYHRLKTVACLIAAAAAVFGVMNLPIPLQFKLYAIGAAVIAAPAFVWWLL